MISCPSHDVRRAAKFPVANPRARRVFQAEERRCRVPFHPRFESGFLGVAAAQLLVVYEVIAAPYAELVAFCAYIDKAARGLTTAFS